MISYPEPRTVRRHPRRAPKSHTLYLLLSIPKSRRNPRPPKLRIFFQVPYPLTLVFSHSSENCRGVLSSFPFWNSPHACLPWQATPHSFILSAVEGSLSLLDSAFTQRDARNFFGMRIYENCRGGILPILVRAEPRTVHLTSYLLCRELRGEPQNQHKN